MRLNEFEFLAEPTSDMELTALVEPRLINNNIYVYMYILRASSKISYYMYVLMYALNVVTLKK